MLFTENPRNRFVNKPLHVLFGRSESMQLPFVRLNEFTLHLAKDVKSIA